jgi:tetratricopeptide (TPR) repeat protein
VSTIVVWSRWTFVCGSWGRVARVLGHESAVDVRSSGEQAAETVGRRLRRLRRQRGLSQRALSGQGISAAYISRIEQDERRPSVRVLRVLAAKLGVGAGYLETGSELDTVERRELRLADVELRLRLEGTAPVGELEEILEEAIATDDLANAVRAQVALGLGAVARGEQAEAILRLEQALGSGLVNPVTRPDVYTTLGECYALAGQPERAADLFESALAELERLAPDDAATRVRLSTYLSYSLTDLGDLEAAGEVLARALRDVDEASDPYTRIRLYWSLGRISHEQAKPLLALDHFRRAVALLETTEDSFHLARAHLSCAAAMLATSHAPADIAQQIEKGERLLGANPEPRDKAVIHRLRASLALRTGAYPDAEQHARAAQTLTRDLPNQHGLATWVLADALAAQTDPAATQAYDEATALIREHGTPRERIDLLRAHAQHLRTHRRETEALDLLEEAAATATALANSKRRPTPAR